jgi:5'(3')-deoxyribonucleotidase
MNTSKIIEVHCDLDGLFADFDAGVKKLTGKHPKDLEKKQLWKAINWNKRFFADLAVIDGSMDLWAAIKDMLPDEKIKFLTGAPSVPAFREQKRVWVAETFGPQYEVNVVPRRDKQLWSGPLKILIDDTHGNIHDWVVKGGHGIHHQGSFGDTINELKQYAEAISS